MKFAVQNPKLSFGEVYKDLNKRAFMREAQKLCPSVTLDMVEESFAGVMAQVFDSDGAAAKDYIFERKVRPQCLLCTSSDWLLEYKEGKARSFLLPRVGLSVHARAQVLDGTTLNVRNAPSPACTASLAIAETVVDIAASDFGWGPAAKLK